MNGPFKPLYTGAAGGDTMRLWILGILGITLVGVLACTVGGLSEEEVDSLSGTAVAKALTAVPTPTPDIPATVTAAVEATMVALPTTTPAPTPTPKVIIVEKEVLKEVIKGVVVEKEVIKEIFGSFISGGLALPMVTYRS